MSINNKQSLLAVTLSAIGVVYGDIGTSPLYTLRECLSGQFGFTPERDVIFGFLSLIFWLLILVVSIKYLLFVMRADHAGEGSILTLMSLAERSMPKKMTPILIIIGLVGSSFFYGEAVITPAISVMSAIEGLEIIAPQLKSWVIPLSIMVLTVLFAIQKHGTELVGRLFSPIMVAWFMLLLVLGLRNIITNPDILHALNPICAIHFFIEYKALAFIALGPVALSITGVEALHADMSHFGKLPIRLAWFLVVLPSLVLNYFGQGALLLQHPEAIKNPFFLLASDWALVPILLLATLATVIASQAVISGVFALTRQAIQLGYLSPMRIIYTSQIEPGQIYIPFMNWLLYFAVVVMVVFFKNSSALAAAYGIALTGTMILTSILSATVAYYNWHWNKQCVNLILLCCFCLEAPLFFANLDKIVSGGWLSLILSLIMFTIMTTWKNERSYLLRRIHENSNSLNGMIDALEKSPPIRVPGIAVYICHDLSIMPLACLHNLKHNKILHERVFLLTLRPENSPYVYNLHRVKIKKLSSTFWSIIASYGWRERLNIEDIFYYCRLAGLSCRILEASFFVSYESLVIGERPWYLHLRAKLYLILHRNATRSSDQFKIPLNRVIVLGKQIEI